MSTTKYRSDFPFFNENPSTVYGDSAATAQKPQIVIDAITQYYRINNANAGRSSYSLARRLDQRVDEVRCRVRSFIHAAAADEVFFTAGATDAFNKVAYSLAFSYLESGDEVLYCPKDHESFTLPWFRVKQLLSKLGKEIILVPYDVTESGAIDTEDLKAKVTTRTKVVNVTHVHNVFGVQNSIHNVCQELRSQGILVNVDATQSAGHVDIDVEHLGADILSFSGHKMFSAQGVGVLYIRKQHHVFMEPIFVGGGPGTELRDDGVIVSNLQLSYEAGTQNYGGIISLGAAMDYIESIGINTITRHIAGLTEYLLNALSSIDTVRFPYGMQHGRNVERVGIVSFTVDRISSADVGFILGENNIYVRTGYHCSLASDISDTVRISLHIYNDKADIDRIVDVLAQL